MTLNARQRTKINAALCLLHDEGHDANSVIHVANELIKQGSDTRSAYEDALNAFIGEQPAMLPVISKIHRLVDASDDGTVDQYDAALSEYVTTGDDSSLNALAPMIAEDSIALALQDGEITQEEADSGDLAKALGFEPGPLLAEAVAGDAGQQQEAEGQQEQQAPAPNQQLPGKWQQQQRPADAPQAGKQAPAPSFVNGSQMGASSAPTGMVAAGAARNWARNTNAPLPNGAAEAPQI
jgi:hypothetical protein